MVVGRKDEQHDVLTTNKTSEKNAILNFGEIKHFGKSNVSKHSPDFLPWPAKHTPWDLGPGPSTEAEAEATEGEDEGILPVQDAAVPPGSSGGGAAGKMEGSEALPPAMPRKEAARYAIRVFDRGEHTWDL